MIQLFVILWRALYQRIPHISGVRLNYDCLADLGAPRVSAKCAPGGLLLCTIPLMVQMACRVPSSYSRKLVLTQFS